MSARDRSACDICGSTSYSVAYEGPIRDGAFGSLTAEKRVLTCETCGTGRLDVDTVDAASFYETRAYREQTNVDSAPSAYCRVHDAQQLSNIEVVGVETLRGVRLADVGCGAGSFLDCVSGLVASALAIEPSQEYRDHLTSRGYPTFAYAEDALQAHSGRIDIVTCFSVIEHVQSPVELVRAMATLLSPGGRLVMSTPSTGDLLLDLLPEDYRPFFYRSAHLHYFDPGSIRRLLSEAGMMNAEVIHRQRFGLSNAMRWLRDGRPCGDSALEGVTPAMDSVWRAELERTGRSDYLYVVAEKEGG